MNSAVTRYQERCLSRAARASRTESGLQANVERRPVRGGGFHFLNKLLLWLQINLNNKANENMRTKMFLFRFFGLSALATLFIIAPVFAGGGGPVITKILTSGHQLQDGDSFTLQAYSSGQYKVKTFNLYLDGKLFKTCKGKKVCGAIFGPFSGEDAGQHRYDIVVTDVKGWQSTRQYGFFWVNATADESGDEADETTSSQPVLEPSVDITPVAPAVVQMITNKNVFTVGEKLNLSVVTKSKSPILFIDVIVDNKIIKTCNKSSGCAAVTGVFTGDDVGEHKYLFNIVNSVGGVERPWGKFIVNAIVAQSVPANNPIPAQSPALPAVAAQVWPSFDKIITNGHQLYPGDNFTLKIFATDTKGINDVEVVVDDQVIKKCVSAVCEASVGPFGAADVGEHKYVFNVTNQDGNQIHPWGKFWVNKKEMVNSAPAPTPNSAPTIIGVTTNGNAFNVGDSLKVKVLAKDNQGLVKILIQIDGTPVLLCAHTDICGTIVGPFTSKDAGEHTYSFVATNVDGQTATSWGKYTVTEKDVVKPTMALTATIGNYKDKALPSDKINLTASADDAGGIAKIEIFEDSKLVRTCFAAECKYEGGPYLSAAGKTINFRAIAYDTTGNAINAYLPIKIENN